MTDKRVGVRIDVGVDGKQSVQDLTKQLDGLEQGAASVGEAGKTAAAGTRQFGQAAQAAATNVGQAEKATEGLGSAAAQADPKLDRARRSLEGVNASAEQSRRTLADLRDQLVAGFAFKELVQAAAEMEQVQAGLQAVAGDSRLAGEQLEFVRRMAQAAGVDVVSAGKAFLGLAAATKGTAVEGEPARQVFEAVTLAMAKAGKSSAETQNALLALSQIASKGTVSMEELRGQLGEALPGALQAAANGLGITTQDLIKLVETGQLAAEDLFPALSKGLKDLYGGAPAAQTLSQEITNIKNAFVEMAANVGDQGGLDALKVGAEAAQAAITFLGDTLIQTGQYIGTLAGAVATLDFSGLSEAFKQIEEDSRTRLLKAAEHNTVLQAALKAGGDEATKTALAAKEAAAANEQAGAAAAAAGTSVAKLAVEYAKARTEIEQQLTVATKEVEAAKARGQASIAQASALNDESAKRRAVGEAAAAEAAALEKVAKIRSDELELLKKERAAKEDALAAGGKISDQRKKELEDLDALITKKQVERDISLAQAAAAREQAKATSERVQAAQREQETTEAVAIARNAAAKAALSDLQIQKDLAIQAGEIARLMGDEEGLRKAKILQLDVEIKLIKAKAEVQRIEAEGTIAVARAKLAELEASNQLTPVKRAEIQASIQLAEAKVREAKVLASSTQALDLQLQRLRDTLPASTAAAGGFGRLSDAQEVLANKTDRATDALTRQQSVLQQQQYDKDKFALGSDGQRITAGGQLKPPDSSGNWEFVGDVRASNLNGPPGSVGVMGQGWWVPKGGSGSTAMLGGASSSTGGAFAGGNSADPSALRPATTATATPAATTRTLRLDLGGGRSMDYQATSDAEAARVESLLRTLASEAGRAGP